MADYRVTLRGNTWVFGSLRELLAKASTRRSGDELAGLSAATAVERAAAQHALAEVPLTQFLAEPLVPYESDEVTRLILDTHDAAAFARVRGLSVGQFRDWLLRYETTGTELAALAPGLTPEMVAAVSKLMRHQDLILVAAKCEVVTRFRNTLGQRGTLAVRLQPNHPTDDPRGIAASTIDGLLHGCGDAVIGINPATDSPERVAEILRLVDDVIQTYAIPTQSCVLAHVTTQLAALERGAPLDLMFQSIAGTEAANASFGVSLSLLREAREATLALQRGPLGADVMYFETGQGSCLSANAHHGIDQQTLEARAYAVARAFSPLLVNTVVGFIGPEYLFDGKQIIRAGLEDHFCGKLLGLPMGVDVCYTNHAEADQDDMDNLLTLLGTAGVNYIMGVPGADDIMLGYQSTSFHDAHYLRQLLGKKPAPEFAAWLARMEIQGVDNRLLPIAAGQRLLQRLPIAPEASDAPVARGASPAQVPNALDAPRPPAAADPSPALELPASPWAHLRRYTAARIALGRSGGSLPTPESLTFALDHALARDAVHTPFDPAALAAELRTLPGVPEICVLNSAAADRATYLRRPDLGRRLAEESAAQLAACSAEFRALPTADTRAPDASSPSPSSLAIIVSDGLSALAAQRQAPALLRELLPRLRAANFTLTPLCVTRHARVGIIDEIGTMLGADFALILLGERPGLGTPDSLSAYFTRAPASGRTDADRNCVSNIRPAGLPPADAAIKLTAWLIDARTQKRSGVALKEPATPLPGAGAVMKVAGS